VYKINAKNCPLEMTITNLLLFQVLRNSRMTVRYHPAAAYDAAGLMDNTVKTAKARFCSHRVTSLLAANCVDQIRATRARTLGHSVVQEEFCETCYSSIQEEIMSMLTKKIVPDVAKFLCSGCGDILNFRGNPLQQCPSCDTSFRVSISTLISIAAPPCSPLGKEAEISQSAPAALMKKS
jgi:hypothetical protein